MKQKLPIKAITIILFILIVASIFLIIGRQTSLIGIGQDYTLNTEDFKLEFHTNDKYYIQDGCLISDCSNLNGCGVKATKTDTVGNCDIVKCELLAWWDCTTSSTRQDCMYGNNCNPSSSCSYRCSWYYQDMGTKGGINYKSQDGCAYWMDLKDKSGNLIKSFSQLEEIDGWQQDRQFYLKDISYNENNIKIDYIESQYDSQEGECLGIKFKVEDDRYRYDVCLGNDQFRNTEGTYCEDSLIKTCKLQCNDNSKELDLDTCNCIDIIIEEPTEEPVEEPVEEPTEEPTEEPINEPVDESIDFFTDSNILIGLGFLLIIVIGSIVYRLRDNKNGKKRKNK